MSDGGFGIGAPGTGVSSGPLRSLSKTASSHLASGSLGLFSLFSISFLFMLSERNLLILSNYLSNSLTNESAVIFPKKEVPSPAHLVCLLDTSLVSNRPVSPVIVNIFDSFSIIWGEGGASRRNSRCFSRYQ